MSIGENISKNRKLKKLKLIELAEIINISQPYLSYIENDTKTPSLEVLISIAKALDITVGSLLDEPPLELSNDLKELLSAANQLSPKQLKSLNTFLKDLRENK